MSSTRLPGKSLMSLAGKSILGHTVSRILLCQRADAVLVATSSHDSDDPIAVWCAQNDINCFRGDLNNVAGRIYAATASSGATGCVRISADSPFIDPNLVDHAISLFQQSGVDLVTNTFPRTFPTGQSVEVIRIDALRHVIDRNLTPEQQEHVTRFFYDEAHSFDIRNFEAAELLMNDPHDYSRVHLAVDSQEDWVLAVQVMERLGDSTTTATWLDLAKTWKLLTANESA